MNGKRAKRLRRVCEAIFVEEDIEKNHTKVKVGRTHGGPAFGHTPYPPSQRWTKKGDFDVLEISTDELRAAAGELEQIDTAMVVEPGTAEDILAKVGGAILAKRNPDYVEGAIEITGPEDLIL